MLEIYELTAFKFRKLFVTETLTTPRVGADFAIENDVCDRLMEYVLFSTCIKGS